MKKFFALILSLGLIVSLCACGKVDITMQEIYDAGKTEAMLKDHQSAYIRDDFAGGTFGEKYMTKEYVYDCVYDEEFDWAEFVTDDVCYAYIDGGYVRYLPIDPDGVKDGFANYRAEVYASVIMGGDTVYETIESVSKKDGRITVTSVLSEKNLEILAEDGVTSGKFEYALDAKTRDFAAITGDYILSDGTAYHMESDVSYDTDAPERVQTFLEYANQTENLRNITVVSNPGTEKEVSQSVQSPKGMVVGLRYDGDSAHEFGVYTDATCTEAYDSYADTDSDLTIYIKWAE